ncbi:hypothetical protein [Methanolobus sp.]|jgi:hypothetical protein|uniref:hypothetical protein n=1 Tax=Methanolobus sp. TaxID=1874737 RepID=UPI0025F36ECF|nr:hypothetical protein [Methanolobus sp.]
MERVLYGLVILFVGILIGSSGDTLSCGPVPVEGLLIVDGSAWGGSSDENQSIHRYNYEFTLYNNGQDDIYITKVEPLLAESRFIISSQDSVSRLINSNVAAGYNISVNGSIELFTENLSKEEILDIQPIVYVNISSTQTIPYLIHET